MLIHFVVGLKKMLGAVMPVYVEVQGMTGTLRARCQLIPDPPFIKNTTIAFMGLPKVVISATPLTKHFLNAMKLPLVSQFINSSINAAMRDFCAPKCKPNLHLKVISDCFPAYTVDVQDLLLEDDVKVGSIYLNLTTYKPISATLLLLELSIFVFMGLTI